VSTPFRVWTISLRRRVSNIPDWSSVGTLTFSVPT
jgi:hypothetical protein